MSVPGLGKTIFIVEDDPKIRGVLRDYSIAAGYQTAVFGDGGSALTAAKQQPPNLIILDLMLPGMDGIAFCKRLRTFSAAPVLVLTARIDENDRIMGLEAGADDYVCKPFSSREIMARVAALIRRAEHNFALAADPAVNHAIDELSKRISWKGNWLGLSNSEFQILAALMKQPGRVFSREQLLDQIGFGFRDVSDRAIDSHVKNIRRKVSTIDPGATCIASVYGAGYRFQTDPS